MERTIFHARCSYTVSLTKDIAYNLESRKNRKLRVDVRQNWPSLENSFLVLGVPAAQEGAHTLFFVAPVQLFMV